jgi:glycosyltransferase involved in cell wall biosynthesis
MMPLVSICLPVFNHQHYLHETIRSIQNQTYPNIEIIAVDDCSVDESYEVLRAYESKNFIVQRNDKNLGMKGNWNRCLDFASGKYIKMMGADDLLMSDCIAKQVEVLESVDVDLVSSNRCVISGNGRTLLKLRYPLSGYVAPKEAIKKLIGSGRNIIGEPVACLIRKESLAAIGGFSAMNRYVIDIETWAKLIRNKGFFALDGYLCSFRISNNSTSSKEGLNQIRSVFQFISSFPVADIGLFTKFKAYFLATVFGIVRNIVFMFSNRAL